MKMKIVGSALIAGIALFAVSGFVGCSNDTSSTTPTAVSSATDWQAGLDSEVIAALSELPEADRGAALRQKVCPVTDKQLGSMGKPPKVTVGGQEVFLCCDGCESEIKSNPEQYLAKLNDDQ